MYCVLEKNIVDNFISCCLDSCACSGQYHCCDTNCAVDRHMLWTIVSDRVVVRTVVDAADNGRQVGWWAAAGGGAAWRPRASMKADTVPPTAPHHLCCYHIVHTSPHSTTQLLLPLTDMLHHILHHTTSATTPAHKCATLLGLAHCTVPHCHTA